MHVGDTFIVLTGVEELFTHPPLTHNCCSGPFLPWDWSRLHEDSLAWGWFVFLHVHRVAQLYLSIWCLSWAALIVLGQKGLFLMAGPIFLSHQNPQLDLRLVWRVRLPDFLSDLTFGCLLLPYSTENWVAEAVLGWLLYAKGLPLPLFWHPFQLLCGFLKLFLYFQIKSIFSYSDVFTGLSRGIL